MPPQSPVAWSTFITGMGPDEHGIFDFVLRDPATLEPFSSMGRVEEPRFSVPLGPYILPLSGSRIVSLRKGTAFWQLLAGHGVPVTVVRMPTNYPPLAAGRALAGMGTPDLRGTLGTFSFYTDDPEEISRSVAGGRIVKIDLADGHARLPLEGPPPANSAARYVDLTPLLSSRSQRRCGPRQFRRPHQVWRRNIRDFAGRVVRLAAGRFPIDSAPGIGSRHVSRVRETAPPAVRAVCHTRQYRSRVAPALASVAAPSSFGRDIARQSGRYYTMGIPEDTSALRQGVFTLPQFLAQTRLVFDDERRLLSYSLRHFGQGLLFFYFSVVDENSHMLWGRHEPELLDVYRAVDGCVGEVMREVPAAELIVLSDHGFTTFDRAVHLNTWLRHRGFLTLRGPPGDETMLSDLDWSSTEAYGLGLNGLYLNLRGREKYGIVERGRQSAALLENLREQLLAFRDPANGRQVVEAVYETRPAKENAAAAPDLIVGYGRGYRGSWQTALGGVPAVEIEDNNDAWIADHCINPADVPGVLFSSRPLAAGHPRLQDVTGMVLKLFGLAPPRSAIAVAPRQ